MKNLIVLAFIPLLYSKVIDPSKVSFAVNCGHEGTMKSAGGYLYKKDTGYSSESKVSDYFLNPELAKIPIKYTYDEAIYKTERHGDTTFDYQIPVKKDGTYTIILKFCEVKYTLFRCISKLQDKEYSMSN